MARATSNYEAYLTLARSVAGDDRTWAAAHAFEMAGMRCQDAFQHLVDGAVAVIDDLLGLHRRPPDLGIFIDDTGRYRDFHPAIDVFKCWLSLWHGQNLDAVGRTDLDIAYPYVDIDNEQIAYDAMQRLMDKGCRRIALQLLVQEDQASTMRLAGHGRAMAEAGIPIDQSLIGHGMVTVESSAAWFDRLLASSDPPTGLACANEMGLLGALHAVGRRGFVPGSDIHIVTRDSTRLARFLPAKIGVHFVDMAGVEVLESRIVNTLGPVETVLFKGEFDLGEWSDPKIGGLRLRGSPHEDNNPIYRIAWQDGVIAELLKFSTPN